MRKQVFTATVKLLLVVSADFFDQDKEGTYIIYIYSLTYIYIVYKLLLGLSVRNLGLDAVTRIFAELQTSLGAAISILYFCPEVIIWLMSSEKQHQQFVDMRCVGYKCFE